MLDRHLVTVIIGLTSNCTILQELGAKYEDCTLEHLIDSETFGSLILFFLNWSTHSSSHYLQKKEKERW